MPRQATTAIVIAGLFLAAPAAADDFAVPSCDELLAWAEGYDVDQAWTMNAETSIPNIFAPEVTAEVFATPVLDWGRADVKGLNRSLARCAKKARRAKDMAANDTLGNVRTLLNREVRRPISRLERARPEVAREAEALLGLPATPGVYKALSEIRGPEGAPPDPRALRNSRGPETRPFRRLVKQLRFLPDEEYRELAERFAARREDVQAEFVEALVADLAEMPESNDGLLQIRERLQELEQNFGADLTAEQRRAIEEAAESRQAEIAAALGQSEGGTETAGAQAPIALPECEELLRWAAQTDWNDTLATPGGYVPMVLMDERMVPLFGKSLREWSEVDFASYRRLKDHCFEVAKTAPQGSELQALFKGRGRYANDLGIKMPSYQKPLGQYHELRQALARAEARIANAPEGPEGLRELNQVLRDPGLRAARYQERTRLQQEISARRLEIAAAVLKPDIQKLAAFEATLDNLKALPAFRRDVQARHATYLSRQELQRFEAAYALHYGRIASKARPEFEAFLASVPANAEGLEQIEAELSALQSGDGASFSILRPYTAKAHARTQQIREEIAQAHCDELVAGTGLAEADAERPVLISSGTVPLRDLLCALDSADHQVHSFAPAEEAQDAFSLKITPKRGVYQTITLHEAEVGPDQRALVGLSVADANVEKTLTVKEWQSYVDALKRGRSPELAALQSGAGAGRGGSLDARLQSCRTLVQQLDDQGRDPDDLSQKEQAALMACLLQFGPMIGSQAIEDGSCERLLNTPESELSQDEKMEALSCTMHSMLQESGQLQ